MTGPSTAWTQVQSLICEQEAGDLPVLEVDSANGEEAAIAGLLAWFDQHSEGSAVLLRVDDKDLGTIGRDEVLDAVAPSDRGGLGDGDGLTLPGLPPDFKLFEYVCPMDGCHRRKAVVGLDAALTPTCPVHGIAMVPDGAR
jgi:hypothetical protein